MPSIQIGLNTINYSYFCKRFYFGSQQDNKIDTITWYQLHEANVVFLLDSSMSCLSDM